MASRRRFEWVCRRTPAALCALFLALPAAAQSLYCCKDERGRKVCADQLPAQCVGKPHTVRGPGGKTTSVEGWLSPAERKAKEDEEERRKLAEEAAAEQQRLDRALLATYGSVRDIDSARARAERDLLESIKQAEQRIEVAQKRRKKFENEAEFYKSKPIPAEIKRGMRDTENEVKAQNELIALKRNELAGLQAKYDAEKARYLALTVQTRERRER